MKTESDARRLAESLVGIGRAAGVRTEAVLTSMEAPLGRAVGNALEVCESLEVLKGGGPADLVDVSLELAGRMLVLGGAAADRADADRQARRALASGAALERFRRIVEAQGGDPRIVDAPDQLPAAPGRRVITAPHTGYLVGLDAALIGRASAALGAGRDRVDDVVDPAVGITILAKPGDPVGANDPVLTLHYREAARLAAALPLAARAVAVGDAPPPVRSPILASVS
jgi:thymidine phosphorylase